MHFSKNRYQKWTQGAQRLLYSDFECNRAIFTEPLERPWELLKFSYSLAKKITVFGSRFLMRTTFRENCKNPDRLTISDVNRRRIVLSQWRFPRDVIINCSFHYALVYSAHCARRKFVCVCALCVYVINYTMQTEVRQASQHVSHDHVYDGWWWWCNWCE